MKATVSKSAVMKRAWRIYRVENMPLNSRYCRGPYTFGMALRSAWKKEKQEVEMKNRTPKVTKTVFVPSADYAAGLIDSYTNGSGGRTYFGD